MVLQARFLAGRPPGRLNAVPWSLLPSLSGRAVSVAPSARSRLRARQAHIAAHGVFRADGPMTVHDVERLGRVPFRLILPSCESGRLAPAGADELLGARAEVSGGDPEVTAAGWSFIALGRNDPGRRVPRAVISLGGL